MVYSHILIRFGELNTKGKNKKDFINTLYSNIKFRLKAFMQIKYKKAHDRLYLNIENMHASEIEQIVEIMKEIPGISSFSLVYKCANDIDQIVANTLILAQKAEGKTFKVKTRRADKRFLVHSDQVNRLVAVNILHNTSLLVDIHHPDIQVNIEIRNEGCFIFANTIKGAGGYPLGVGGKVLVLISGGIDSPVAMYSMMRRGVKVEAIHFASPPYTSKQAQDKVIDNLRVLARFCGKIKLHIVNFTALQEKIYEACEESYAVTIMRRMMYRISERVAIRNKCLALAGGESIGQVASQTLDSMRAINQVISLPMIRPLATIDKNDIIEIAKKIRTYDISIRPFIDCCTIFEPKNPVTKPKTKFAELMESRFDYAPLVETCIATVKTFNIDENYQEVEDNEQFF